MQLKGKTFTALAYFGTWYFGTWYFGKRHFGMNISSWGLFGIDVAAQGHCRTKTLQHMYILALCKSIYTFETFPYGCPCAKMSKCQNILMPKSPSAITYLRQNIHGLDKYPCWNVLMPKCPVPKSPCDEMSMPKCVSPKCQVLKSAQANYPCFNLWFYDQLQT